MLSYVVSECARETNEEKRKKEKSLILNKDIKQICTSFKKEIHLMNMICWQINNMILYDS